VRRSASARARAFVISSGVSRASKMTKSLPSPCIFTNRRFIVAGI
jgi:hypothetical protein